MRLYDAYDVPNLEGKDINMPPCDAYDFIDRIRYAIENGEEFIMELDDGTQVMCTRRKGPYLGEQQHQSLGRHGGKSKG